MVNAITIHAGKYFQHYDNVILLSTRYSLSVIKVNVVEKLLI